MLSLQYKSTGIYRHQFHNCGIGNLANTVPPTKWAIAEQLHVSVERIDVLLFGHAYVVQCLRQGTTGDAPFHLSAFLDWEDITTQLDLPSIFSALPRTLEHEYTQLLMAASAATVFDVLTTMPSTIAHAPGPNGLPGAYPVRVGNEGLEIVLSPGLYFEEALRINQEGQRFDGIEKIEPMKPSLLRKRT